MLKTCVCNLAVMTILTTCRLSLHLSDLSKATLPPYFYIYRCVCVQVFACVYTYIKSVCLEISENINIVSLKNAK